MIPLGMPTSSLLHLEWNENVHDLLCRRCQRSVLVNVRLARGYRCRLPPQRNHIINICVMNTTNSCHAMLKARSNHLHIGSCETQNSTTGPIHQRDRFQQLCLSRQLENRAPLSVVTTETNDSTKKETTTTRKHGRAMCPPTATVAVRPTQQKKNS